MLQSNKSFSSSSLSKRKDDSRYKPRRTAMSGNSWQITEGEGRRKGERKRREEKSESGSGRGNEVCGGGRESRDVILIIYRDNKQPDFSSAKSSELRGRYRVSGLARAGFTEGCLLAWRLASGGVFIVDESWSSCRSPLGWGRGKENKNFFSKTSFPSRLLLIHC